MSQKSNPTCKIGQSRHEIQIYRGGFDNQDIVLKSTLYDWTVKR